MLTADPCRSLNHQRDNLIKGNETLCIIKLMKTNVKNNNNNKKNNYPLICAFDSVRFASACFHSCHACEHPPPTLRPGSTLLVRAAMQTQREGCSRAGWAERVQGWEQATPLNPVQIVPHSCLCFTARHSECDVAV